MHSCLTATSVFSFFSIYAQGAQTKEDRII